ncbi:hypothetical protein [Brevibacillus borstelensis]|uniref:hypothetical protein n=1 Tax=Brevibacillus borstelensis TaxID=45462 RepID=UPI0030F60485
MKHEKRPADDPPQRENEPFNSVVDHYRNIVGTPSKPIDMESMPKPLKWFGYIVFGILLTGSLLLLIAFLIT